MPRVSLLLVLVAAAACTTKNSAATDSAAMADSGSKTVTTADENSSRDAIQKIRTAWKDAAERKDSAAVAGYYADDAVLATSQAPAVTGRGDIEKTLGRMVNLSKVTSIDSKDLVVMGDDAYDYGTFSQEAPGPDGKTVSSTGYYVVTLHKQGDGTWKITRHVSTTPPSK